MIGILMGWNKVSCKQRKKLQHTANHMKESSLKKIHMTQLFIKQRKKFFYMTDERHPIKKIYYLYPQQYFDCIYA